MNEQIRQAAQLFSSASAGSIPANIQALAVDSVGKTREALLQVNGTTRAGIKAAEDLAVVAYAGARSIIEKMLHNVEANTKAALDAAEALVSARSLPEAFRLQASYVRAQSEILSAQTKEIFEISGSAAQQTFEALNTAASKSMARLKSA